MQLRQNTYQKTTGCLTPGAHPGSYNGQDAFNDMFVTEERKREREKESMEHWERSAGSINDESDIEDTGYDARPECDSYYDEEEFCICVHEVCRDNCLDNVFLNVIA